MHRRKRAYRLRSGATCGGNAATMLDARPALATNTFIEGNGTWR